MKKYLAIALPFLLVFLFVPMDVMSTDNELGALTYSFQHANIFHLIGNMMVLIPLLYAMRGRYKMPVWVVSVVPYACAVVSALLYDGERSVGASGFVYALLGIYYTSAICGYHLKVVNKKWFSIYVAFVLAAMVIPSFFGGVNLFIHVSSFVLGSAFAFVKAGYYNVVRRGYS